MKKSRLTHQGHTAMEGPSWSVTRGFLVFKAEVCLPQAWEVLTELTDTESVSLIDLERQGYSGNVPWFMHIYFFFCSGSSAACESLAPWPVIEPRPPELGAWSLSHWTTREIPVYAFLHFLFRPLVVWGGAHRGFQGHTRPSLPSRAGPGDREAGCTQRRQPSMLGADYQCRGTPGERKPPLGCDSRMLPEGKVWAKLQAWAGLVLVRTREEHSRREKQDEQWVRGRYVKGLLGNNRLAWLQQSRAWRCLEGDKFESFSSDTWCNEVDIMLSEINK